MTRPQSITFGMWLMVTLLAGLLAVFLIVDAIMWRLGGDQTFSEWMYLESRLHWWVVPLYTLIWALLGLHFFL